MRQNGLLLFTLFGLLTPAHADGDTRRPLPAVKASGAAPTIDGDLSEPFWKSAARAEGFTDRQTALSALQQTVAWITYDDTYLYVAFACTDSQPAGIVGRETIRDSHYQNDSGDRTEDWVEVSLDPFLSFKNQDFARFSVNAIGTRSARIGGGRASKAEWNGEWDAAVKRTPDGWTAEMRIPWATLNFPTGRRELNMGVNFNRFQYRTRIRSEWSFTGQQHFDDQEGRWTGVQPPRSAFKPTLSLLPYLLPRAGDLKSDVRSGVDARYTLTPDFTVVASVNPDFATVEGAVQNVSFSRSEQFLPERRPFFLEGGNYFESGTFYSLGPMFYSNRIQGFDFGAKAFGKLTPRDTLGVLATADFDHRSDVVARYRRDLSPTAQAGLFMTRSENRDGSDHSGVISFDGNVRHKKVGLEWQGIASGGTDAGGHAGQLNFQYFDSYNFTSLQYLAVAPDFRNPNGLVFFNDFKGFQGYTNWNREWAKGAWRNFEVDFSPAYTFHYNGKPFQRGANLGVGFETRSDWRFGVNVDHFRFDDQTDHTIGGRVIYGATNRFRQIAFRMNSGTQGGHGYRYLGPSFSVRAIKDVDLIYQGALVDNVGWTKQHVLTLNYLLSRTRQIGGRLVSLAEPGQKADITGYLSFRSAGEAGTEMYVLVGDPNARTFKNLVMVKLIFAV